MADIAVAHLNSPFVSAYPWADSFGAKYSNPGTALPSSGRAVAFSGGDVALGHNSSPFISAYPWDSGFGTKYSDPGTLPPSTALGLAFTPDGQGVAVAHISSPFVTAYPWDSGFGAKYTDPATLPASTGRAIAFSNDAVAIAHDSSPFVSAYPWSAGFGAKYSNPGTLPTGNSLGVAFTRTGDALAVAHGTTPFVSAYPWSAGFGTKYADPGTLPASTGRSVSFSQDGNTIAIGHSSSPFVSAYPWSAGFGTKYSDPATLPTGDGFGVTLSPDGASLAVAHGTSPFVSAYRWGQGFGTKYADPGTLPTGDGSSVAFTPPPLGHSHGSNSGSVSLAFPHTVSDGTTMLSVTVETRNGPVTGVYWDGELMTSAVASQDSGVEASIWYLVDPEAKTADVTIDTTGSASGINGGASNLPNVNMVLDTDTQGGFATSKSRTVTTKPGNIVIDALAGPDNGSGDTPTVGAGQEQLHKLLISDTRGASSYEVAAGDSTTMSWSTLRNENWQYAVAVFAVRPEITDGPHVFYPDGQASTVWVLGFTATGDTDTLGWEVWTGPNRTGAQIGSGTCQKDQPTAIRFDGGVTPGQPNTLYLTVDDEV